MRLIVSVAGIDAIFLEFLYHCALSLYVVDG